MAQVQQDGPDVPPEPAEAAGLEPEQQQRQGDLFARIARIQAAIPPDVPQNGHARVQPRDGAAYEYRYVQEHEMMEALRPLLGEHGVAILPNVVAVEHDGKGNARVRLTLTLAAESGATYTTQPWEGTGWDKGDKAVYKAYTGAMRYALQKTFLIGTDGPHPEQENADTAPMGDAAAGARPGGMSSGRRPPQGGGRGQDTRLISEAQRTRLWAIARKLPALEGVANDRVDRFVHQVQEWTTGGAILSTRQLTRQHYDAVVARVQAAGANLEGAAGVVLPWYADTAVQRAERIAEAAGTGQPEPPDWTPEPGDVLLDYAGGPHDFDPEHAAAGGYASGAPEGYDGPEPELPPDDPDAEPLEGEIVQPDEQPMDGEDSAESSHNPDDDIPF